MCLSEGWSERVRELSAFRDRIRAEITMQPQGQYPGYEHTAVNMAPNPTTTYGMKPPKDYLAWSLFNFLFLNGCCLGYVATVFSIRSRDSRQMNDQVGAAKHASTAKALNIAATVFGIIMLIVCVILYVRLMLMLQHVMQKDRSSYGGLDG
uniref:dispanin subfamily A member 2b-like isoform X2 n=1 Tax=Myxine glutinosa TaxID=7769 RepID=UPI00358E4DA9